MQLSLPAGDDLKETLQHLKDHASGMEHATLLDYLSKNIKTFPLAVDTVPVGTIIERGRRNIADELFYSESEITYTRILKILEVTAGVTSQELAYSMVY